MVRRGFTLIELLIVVAIIAILAAIAIPNMLEAHTRAKVSRSKADIRSVVLALEAYRVDSNGYPTYHYANAPSGYKEFHIGGKVPSWGAPDPDWNGQNPLTTPVSYISTFPNDPFASHWGGPSEVREYLYVNWPYAVQQCASSGYYAIFREASEKYGAYRIHSRGPDLEGPDTAVPYDATNGTRSRGDITYGPNAGFDRVLYMATLPPENSQGQ